MFIDMQYSSEDLSYIPDMSITITAGEVTHKQPTANLPKAARICKFMGHLKIVPTINNRQDSSPHKSAYNCLDFNESIGYKIPQTSKTPAKTGVDLCFVALQAKQTGQQQKLIFSYLQIEKRGISEKEASTEEQSSHEKQSSVRSIRNSCHHEEEEIIIDTNLDIEDILARDQDFMEYFNSTRKGRS